MLDCIAVDSFRGSAVRNAPVSDCPAIDSSPAASMPMRRTRSGCCACAASDQAVAPLITEKFPILMSAPRHGRRHRSGPSMCFDRVELSSLLQHETLIDVAVGRVEDGRGSLGPFGQRPVSHPRSSNRTSRFPASGFPTGFAARYTESKRTARGFGTVSNSPSPLDTAISGGACH